ncbi:MAG: amidohydrolase family protein [Chloroflexi bacterium]|nr:amidohydrolase family protein [Chloroflexota bacterium]MCY3914324.1 amidohydrolase family protein [Chloroflexota bacterium]MCY4111853.1 amidohydrolase family protein [Chloroflexota bacterium]
MIIDVHSHCLQPDHVSEASRRADERAGYPPMQPLPFETYQEAMRVVDKSVVFGVRALACGALSPNDFTAEWVAKDPDRIIGFMCIDPTEDGYLEEIERGVELGLRGIKIYPMLAHFNPADPFYFALYEKAQRLELPILSHVGTHPNPRAILKYSHPLLFDEVAQAFPDLKIVIAHMGHPWQRDCAVVIRKHANVYADVSGAGWVRPYSAWEALVLMVEWGVADKLLFGSDFPFWTPEEGMTKMRRLNEQVEGTNLPRIPDDVIEGIIHRNTLELLGLE